MSTLTPFLFTRWISCYFVLTLLLFLFSLCNARCIDYSRLTEGLSLFVVNSDLSNPTSTLADFQKSNWKCVSIALITQGAAIGWVSDAEDCLNSVENMTSSSISRYCDASFSYTVANSQEDFSTTQLIRFYLAIQVCFNVFFFLLQYSRMATWSYQVH